MFGSLKGYLDFRQDDIGKPMICALLRFVEGLHLSAPDLQSAAEVESNVARQVCVVNDICDWVSCSLGAVNLKTLLTLHSECLLRLLLSPRAILGYDREQRSEDRGRDTDIRQQC